MSQNLVIMESPSKAQTVKGYLGTNFKVVASMGHVRDLPKSTFGINIENGFQPHYINIRGKGDLIDGLKKEVHKAKTVYLATDPDREGEAIAWHLVEALEIPAEKIRRVCFDEITRNAVRDAVKKPRALDMNLVDSQQTRRLLDRIVGYKLSPILWKGIQSGLSAGRVQSVTTRIIVEREREIQAFVPTEYWTVTAEATKNDQPFTLTYYGVGNEKDTLGGNADADAVLHDVRTHGLCIRDVHVTQKAKRPAPPFTTSVLQQEAFRKLGFSSSKTMKLAQQLYEGVYLGERRGFIGLITYMRTDSVRISSEAQTAARSLIEKKYGKNYLPDEPRTYKVHASAQDAHEAIRPTDVNVLPSELHGKIDADLCLLYKIIWESFVASQMTDALVETETVEATGGERIFHAIVTRTLFDGYRTVYNASEDVEEETNNRALPELTVGETLAVPSVEKHQHFTEAPPRYNEATLIKFLKDMDIGRPSTYAAIISTVLSREYVKREGKSFVPTELGTVITDLMNERFAEIMDYGFTADMEKRLDDIADGNRLMNDVLADFWKDFEKSLADAEKTIKKTTLRPELTGIICDKCGAEMIVQSGRFGRFAACPNYPTCKNTRTLVDEIKTFENPNLPLCEKCGAPLVVKTGRFGSFYACSNYPSCDYTTTKPTDSRVVCPLCGGKIVTRTSKRHTVFYGCENYGKCNFASWDEPTVFRCPKCGEMLYRKGTNLVCHKDGCAYTAKEEGHS